MCEPFPVCSPLQWDADATRTGSSCEQNCIAFSYSASAASFMYLQRSARVRLPAQPRRETHAEQAPKH